MAAGGDVHDWTATQPQRRPGRGGRVALIAIAAVAATCCVAGGTAVVLGGALKGRPASGGDPRSEPKPPGLNESSRDGQFEFVVRSVNCGRATIDNGWLHAEAKGQFCVADLSVT